MDSMQNQPNSQQLIDWLIFETGNWQSASKLYMDNEVQVTDKSTESRTFTARQQG